jgi:hypothetical protein
MKRRIVLTAGAIVPRLTPRSALASASYELFDAEIIGIRNGYAA